MKIGHIAIEKQSDDEIARFAALVESLDKLAVEQHVLVANAALARRLLARPYVTVGPIVRSPVMACCLMPGVDLVHIHGARSGQAGLLLALTRSIPYVLDADCDGQGASRPLQQSVLQRARAQVAPDKADPELLVETYKAALTGEPSKLPENTDCR